MRVLFVVAGGPSHLWPLVPLAWAFRTAGHEVRLGGAPALTGAMTGTGLPAVVLGPGPAAEVKAALVDHAYAQPVWPPSWPAHPELLDDGQRALLRSFGRYTLALSEAMADDLMAFTDQWRPHLIIHDTLGLAAVIAAVRLGVPCVRYTHGTQVGFRTEYELPGGAPLPELSALFHRFGLDPPPGPRTCVDTVPPSMYIGGELPAIPMRWVPFNGPGQVPDGLLGPRPRLRVCVSWGVTLPGAVGAAAADPYRDPITAIAAAGAEVLVLATTAQLATLDPPPPGVRHLPDIPLNVVLPHCDALVHHGGDGTFMAAACVALPQLVVTREPLADESGVQLAATGAAIHLRHPDVSAPHVSAAVDKLLTDPGYQQAATRLRDDIAAQPSPAQVVPTLVALR